MKVLLDENLAHTLRHHLEHHETMTAAFAGFAGLKNGKLLEAAEKAGFDVLVTGDQTLRMEQDMSSRSIALVCLSAISWPVIEPHVEKIVSAVNAATPGSFVRVDRGQFIRQKRLPGIDLD